jgi:L-asparaginase
MPRSKILIISTGGTITMVKGADGVLAPIDNPRILRESVPEIGRIAETEILPLANIDSTNLQPEFWPRLAGVIYDRMDEFEGFVVTHGTDTLTYTAAALSFMLQSLGKPVVVTGSQVPLGEIGTDGRDNIINAVRVAAEDIAEVVVVFGTQVIRGTRAKKTSAFHLQAFTSVNALHVGTIGLNLKLYDGVRRRSRRKPLLSDRIEPSVAMAPIYPGMKPETLSYLASSHAGVVIEGYGAGHVPTEGRSLVPAIKDAVSSGVPVVVCTQCLLGSTEMELYHVGRAALNAGAIPAMDMTPETSLVKLMWVMGQTRDMKSIESMMQKSVAGEIHEIT